MAMPPTEQDEKANLMEALREGRSKLSDLHEEWRADKDVVLAAIGAQPFALQHASEELRADKEVVLEAVKRYGYALDYACPDLRADKEVVLGAVQQAGLALRFASEALQGDKEVVLDALQCESPKSLARKQGASPSQEDVLKMMQQASKMVHGEPIRKRPMTVLSLASEALRADREVVLEAVERNGEALMDASRELRADREVVMAAVKSSWGAAKYAEVDTETMKDLLLLAARHLKGSEHRSFCFKHKGLVGEESFQRAFASHIAIQGEAAPIVSATLSRATGPTEPGEDGPKSDEQRLFRCSASLLSGASFVCLLPDASSSGEDRPPVLNDLARKITEHLSQGVTEAEAVKHVFINFLPEDEEGDPIVVSPWDSNRPLENFLPAWTASVGA